VVLGCVSPSVECVPFLTQVYSNMCVGEGGERERGRERDTHTHRERERERESESERERLPGANVYDCALVSRDNASA
jgi:hypothetical protein